MKILVTGGAGFIGSHVVDTLIQAGHSVVVVDNLSSGKTANLNPAAKLVEMDIRDPKLIDVFREEKPEIVDHHAAQVEVRRSVAEPLFDAGVNVLGSLNVLECARQTGVRKFIYVSSGGAVYGEPVSLPCDENHPIQPICPYGVTKHTLEHYLFFYRQLYGLRYGVLRYANVYGPRQDPNGEAGVVAIFAKKMIRQEPVMINGDGTQERDFVYVSDCARANRLLAEGDAEGIFNLGCGLGVSINQIFEAIKTQTGYQLSAQYGSAKPGETYKIYLDASKAARELGWTPQYDLETGLCETVAFFRDIR